LEVGRELGPEHVVVVVVPDSGRGYLSKLYNDEWMADFGFLRAGGQTVADLLLRKAPDLPALVHVHPDETVRTAIDLLREFDVSQVPIVVAALHASGVKHEPPLAAAEVMGSVHERDLMEQAFADPSVLDRPVGEHKGYEYARTGNPTRAALEACLASLEGGADGLAFASGMAAEDAILRLLGPGDHVVIPSDAYGGTWRLVARVQGPAGLRFTAVDLAHMDALDAAWQDGTRMVWVETP